MTRAAARLIALGAVVGATIRWGVFTSMPATTFPWATLVVNLAGCGLLGYVSQRPLATLDHQRAATVGLCGGLTTFSTFAVEMALLRTAQPGTMWLYLVSSIVGGIAVFASARSLAAAAP